ncbi:MAG TPA: hypothetical protein VJ552_04910 [Sediminibacterium sp.]|nr:hypothetical protein [Sediminibacterium sp.]
MFMQSYIKNLLAGCVFGLMAQVAEAQSNNFLYIQSENSQPYYLQLKGNNYSSNAKGYLLIPQMSNGDYSVVIGFAGDQYPEYTYGFTVANKPKGYSLKLTPEGEWILKDMVSMEEIRGITSEYMPNKSSSRQVQKLLEKVSGNGIDQVYRIKNGTKADTIVLFIPATPGTVVRQKLSKQ